MSWNYRVIRHIEKETNEFWFGIHEVYYSENGQVKHWTKYPVKPAGSSLEDLKGDITLMMKAFDKPTLEVKQNTLLEMRS